MGARLIKRNRNGNPPSTPSPKSPIVHCSSDAIVDISSLVPHPRNPNKHPEDQVKLLAKIMRHQGIRRPIVVSKRSGFIVIGHGRREAAILNGWDKYPVDYQDYDSEAMEYADMVADNKIAELAEVDLSMVGEDFIKFGEDFDSDLLGIPDFEIENADPLGEDEEDEVPPTPTKPKTKRGDLYILGNHRLLCGDATNSADYKKLVGSNRINMVFTDPPYNVDYTGKTKDALKIKNDKMDDEQFRQFLVECFTNMNIYCLEGAPIYVCHADSEGLNFRQSLKSSGWLLKQCCIWVKDSMVMGRQDYHWKHEPILYGWKPGAAHSWNSDRKQTTVWEFDRPKSSQEHPTMKPLALVSYAIKNSCKPKQNVLDPFGGSGSTLISCEKMRRRCFTMELDPKYCDVIVDRWQNLTGKTAKKATPLTQITTS